MQCQNKNSMRIVWPLFCAHQTALTGMAGCARTTGQKERRWDVRLGADEHSGF